MPLRLFVRPFLVCAGLFASPAGGRDLIHAGGTPRGLVFLGE